MDYTVTLSFRKNKKSGTTKVRRCPQLSSRPAACPLVTRHLRAPPQPCREAPHSKPKQRKRAGLGRVGRQIKQAAARRIRTECSLCKADCVPAIAPRSSEVSMERFIKKRQTNVVRAILLVPRCCSARYMSGECGLHCAHGNRKHLTVRAPAGDGCAALPDTNS